MCIIRVVRVVDTDMKSQGPILKIAQDAARVRLGWTSHHNWVLPRPFDLRFALTCDREFGVCWQHGTQRVSGFRMAR